MSSESLAQSEGARSSNDVGSSNGIGKLVKLTPFALAVLGVILARLVGHVALEDVPHVMDEIAYSLQARTFASGHLTAPVPLPRAAFAMWFIDDRERWFSIFPPGWPAVLALGVASGLAAWVNPLLHGSTALLVSRAARETADSRTAIVAAGLYALSPQAILLAASRMSHTLVACLAAIVVVAFVPLIVSHTSRPTAAPAGVAPSSPVPKRLTRLACAGAAIGLAVASRPLCGAILFGAMAIAIAIAWHRDGVRLVDAAFVVAPIGLFLSMLGAYNAHLTGSPFTFPQTAFFDAHAPPVDIPLFTYHPGCNALGFGPSHGCEAGLGGRSHSLENAFSNLGYNLSSWFWLLGGGPVVFALAAFALAERTERATRLALFATVPATLVFYGLYWYAGTCYGARFYHVALPAFFLVAALGASRLAHRTKVAFGTALAAIAIWNAGVGIAAASEISHGYWGTDARFARVASTWQGPPALVLVAFGGEEIRGQHRFTTFMEDVRWLDNIRALGALGQNAPDLSGDVVFARYYPGLMSKLRAVFSGRQLYLYVVHAGTPDRIVPYETSGLSDLEPLALPPPDNFDGFTIPPDFAGRL